MANIAYLPEIKRTKELGRRLQESRQGTARRGMLQIVIAAESNQMLWLMEPKYSLRIVEQGQSHNRDRRDRRSLQEVAQELSGFRDYARTHKLEFRVVNYTCVAPGEFGIKPEELRSTL